jgi:hypothetical protein
MTPVRKILACAACVMGGLLVAAPPSQAHWPLRKHEPVQAPIYAAPEYGAPTMVPMGRNVREEYVYSWGVPSSQVRRIQHGQYKEVSSGAAYSSTEWNGGGCGHGDCGHGDCGSCGNKCGRCGCSFGGLFKCKHRSCSSGCEPKPCGKPSCHKCGGCKGLFGCNHGCNKGCDAAPKCSKPCHKPCSKPCRKTCEKPCHSTCGRSRCGGCGSSSHCCFSLFGCRHRGCSSGCASGGTWAEPMEVPSDSGAMPEEVPGPAPAEEAPMPVPQASHTIETNVTIGSAEQAADCNTGCTQGVKLVSHWQDVKCLHCNGELRPLYGAKQVAGGAFRLICPKCKRYFVLTPTPTPITSTDQMGYYYARVPR